MSEQERSRKLPIWAVAAFLLGLGVQWTLLKNGGLTGLNELAERMGVGRWLGGIPSGVENKGLGMKGGPLKPEKVVIGAVSCQKPGTGNVYNEETAMMMKSIIVSALLYDIPRLEFRLFLEDIPGGRKFFRGKLKEWGFPKDNLKIAVHYHSAIEAIPEKYHDQMIYHKKYRCGFVRHFFPTALPSVDSIIYLDTDMIITGNIGELWGHLGQMTGEQLIGVARNNEPEDVHYDEIHIYGFGDIPHVPPKGVNSGMLVMNLTKMRDYDWQTRIVRLYEDYMKISGWLEDQRLLNIILYYDPGLHQLVPCNFDLMHTHCDKGWVCPPALQDPSGVHVIHGAGDQFDLGGTFYHIYEAYKAVNLSLPSKPSTPNEGSSQRDNLLRELALAIRAAYSPTTDVRSKPDSKCYGTLDKQLYKNWESQLASLSSKQ